ncbi:MAG: hypothetical protein U1E98_04700 [Moraxella osloensis]
MRQQAWSGKGNEGVSSNVQRVANSIRLCLSTLIPKQNRLAYTQLQNRAGKFVMPDDTTFAARRQTSTGQNTQVLQ